MSGTYQKISKNTNDILDRVIIFAKFPFTRRLSTRLLLTLTLLSGIPSIFVGLFMISVTEQSLTQYIQTQHTEIARRAGNEIRLFLETPITILETLVETKDIIEMNPFAQNLMLNKTVAKHPIFEQIFTADTNGNEITTTAFNTELNNCKTTEYFKQAFIGKNYFSPIYFNEVKEPYVISSHPIRQFDQIIGVLAGRINLMSIWELVDEIRIGATGNVFVIGDKGQLIAHKDKKKVLERSEVIDLNLIRNIENQIQKSIVFYNPEGEKMLGTITQLRDFNWLIIIQQSEVEAYELISLMRYQVFAFVGLVIIIAIVLSYLLEKRISSPINSLVAGVKKYAGGDLNYRLSSERYDEISVLANEFNSMAENLMKNQRKLRKAERLAAMSKFASLISHEIRNPLNSMNINMQILKREIVKKSGDINKKMKYFGIIISEIHRMDNLINNFLTISRSPRFDPVPNNIHKILDQVILTHKGMADNQGVKIIKHYYTNDIMANVDGDQMAQVFHNIIINALQAMADGGNLIIDSDSIEIIKSKNFKVSGFRIQFTDSGTGISEDNMEDIFDFYYTSKKTGTGLGLAIARQIIDGHKGRIYANSIDGKGTKLIVEIPFSSENIGIKI